MEKKSALEPRQSVPEPRTGHGTDGDANDRDNEDQLHVVDANREAAVAERLQQADLFALKGNQAGVRVMLMRKAETSRKIGGITCAMLLSCF